RHPCAARPAIAGFFFFFELLLYTICMVFSIAQKRDACHQAHGIRREKHRQRIAPLSIILPHHVFRHAEQA
ncbi:MAG: hypothetical protein IJA26_06755, partial [Clostridia bacterium]|nr:hypothetical protein [Clostridia bacterium]